MNTRDEVGGTYMPTLGRSPAKLIEPEARALIQKRKPRRSFSTSRVGVLAASLLLLLSPLAGCIGSAGGTGATPFPAPTWTALEVAGGSSISQPTPSLTPAVPTPTASPTPTTQPTATPTRTAVTTATVTATPAATLRKLDYQPL